MTAAGRGAVPPLIVCCSRWLAVESAGVRAPGGATKRRQSDLARRDEKMPFTSPGEQRVRHPVSVGSIYHTQKQLGDGGDV